MFAQIRALWAPLLSLCFLVLASGLFNTFSSLRLEAEGLKADSIGLITSALYAGILVGSLTLTRLIEKWGHTRSFAIFACAIAFLAFTPALWIHSIYWAFLRFLGGICSAGIFIVIESWLLIASVPSMRGRMLSVYLGTVYGSLSLGQFLINVSDPLSIYPFCITAALCAISIFPIILKKSVAPKIEEPSRLSPMQLFKISPFGFLGGMISGMLLATIYGLVPIYGKDLGMEVSEIGTLMAIIIFGGLSFQIPFSRWADKKNKRLILNTTCFCTALFGTTIPFLKVSPLLFLLAWCFGGFSFAIYPLSMAYVCEKLQTHQLVAATGGFVLSYGIGAIIGPLLAPFAMNLIGSVGVFYFIALISLLLGLFGLKKAAY